MQSFESKILEFCVEDIIKTYWCNLLNQIGSKRVVIDLNSSLPDEDVYLLTVFAAYDVWIKQNYYQEFNNQNTLSTFIKKLDVIKFKALQVIAGVRANVKSRG